MDLSDRHRHFIWIEQGVHALGINIVMNGAIAWLVLRGNETVPLWGEPSIGIDLLATGLLLPFIMCQIVSRVIAKQVRDGKLPPLPASQIGARGLHHRSITIRALVVTLFGFGCGAAPVVAILTLANAEPVSVAGFVIWKGVWAGLLAMVVSPPIAWWSLSAASLETASQPATGAAVA